MTNKRIFIERKPGYELEKNHFISQIKDLFNLELKSLRYFITYDVFGIEEDVFSVAKQSVFSEPNKDNIYDEINYSKNVIAVESLPGQFDQRADSAMQCVKLINPSSNIQVTSGFLIMFNENISVKDITKLKKFYINKVESREKDLAILKQPINKEAETVPVIDGFIYFSEDELKKYYKEKGFAMSFKDMLFIQDYFLNKEKRDPYDTEIKVLDTYWSDHCRHTTFETMLENITFEEGTISKEIEKTFSDYLNIRKQLKITKPITLMDIATINSKLELHKGNLNDLEISDEINACSIYIDVLIDGKKEKWLLMFKNETHNHPTEIEPFGGASTCIGGAIRDPLSGRSYVYGAMRITGAGDILAPLDKTLKGKLPQRIISKTAAKGYSSYGNQIGLPTTYVKEIYHPGFIAKRLEVGAVLGAVKASDIIREKPIPGDKIILLGGRTGRDGIGGATGSSKIHNENSIVEASTEVQKGNAPEERKIQRLFRNEKVTKLIKKSNDFGAGGVSVAIGELADGIDIFLDRIPVKYQGINGTELAISESQERMAVVVDKTNVELFIKLCGEENIEARELAEVTDTNRLRMFWRNKTICDISRDFISTSGVRQRQIVKVENPIKKSPFNKNYKGNTLLERIKNMLKNDNIASLQGLDEMFDSSIGRTTVLSPYGGKYQATKSLCSVQKIPVKNKSTKTVSIMAYGYDPIISSWSPYHGSAYAIIDSMTKVVSAGGDYSKIRFTFQEYFERLRKDSSRWGKPLSALLGAYNTLKSFNLAAIGGKDSMSGTYQDKDVPPTLISFAVTTSNVENIISPEFKKSNSHLYLMKHNMLHDYLPNIEQLKSNYNFLNEYISNSTILSAYPLAEGGLSEALIKASFGNKIGFDINTELPLFDLDYGSVLIESTIPLERENLIYLGKTNENDYIKINDTSILIEESLKLNQEKYKDVYPIKSNFIETTISTETNNIINKFRTEIKENIIVLNPVFPGTNCEYDTEACFVREGASVKTFVFRNQNETDINSSIKEFSELLKSADILVLNGGFSSGDEPDGSGKFIASVLKNEIVKKSIDKFLKEKKLILGICNGFQALIKSGLLPYGKIQDTKESSPTLFKNDINRHISRFTQTKVSSTNSPWLSSFKSNETHMIPMSHGEGKFVVNESIYKELLRNNQIAFQYVDNLNKPTYNSAYNINGSNYAIEGIISKDGLILGKMGHSERYEKGLFKNVHGNLNQNIFKNAVNYFKNGGVINEKK